MAQYLSALANCPAPRVLTEHEPGAQAANERRHSGQSKGRFLPHLDVLAWKHFERASLRKVDTVVVFTERDRRALAPFLGKTPAVIIPLGIELFKQPLNPEGCLPVNLLFIGSFKHWPNVEAATYLIETIFPRVQDRFPDSKLYIVGDQPPLHLSERTNEQVIVTGRVVDITPYLDRASVIAVPLHYGGGMRVKVLEALAAGKAVVATRLAVEGLDVLDGQQVVLAEDDKDFSNALVRLLAHPQERIDLAGRAHVWASTHLGWDKSVDAYEALYERLLQ